MVAQNIPCGDIRLAAGQTRHDGFHVPLDDSGLAVSGSSTAIKAGCSLCLDNDDAGNDACDRMTDTLEDMGLDVERLCPVRKDWNDDLCAKFERKEKDA